MKPGINRSHSVLSLSILIFVISILFSIYAINYQSTTRKRINTRVAIAKGLESTYQLAERYNGISARLKESPQRINELTALISTAEYEGMEIQTERGDARDNWQLIQSRISYRSATPAELMNIREASKLAHPWSPSSIEATVNTENKLDLTVTFETLTQKQ